MPLRRFTALTAMGSGFWNALFIFVGYRLGERWDEVQQYLQPISYVVVGALIAWATFLIARRLHRPN